MPACPTPAAPAACRHPGRAGQRYALRHGGAGEPTLVGYHWFEHADQPAEGRPDGENSNYGTVTITDAVYADLTSAMAELNAKAEALDADAARMDALSASRDCRATARAARNRVRHAGPDIPRLTAAPALITKS